MESTNLDEARSLIGRDMTRAECFHSTLGEIVALSRRGPSKRLNEDAAALIPYGPDCTVLVIADGLGGQPGADQASQVAIERMIAVLADRLERKVLVREAILDGIEEANRAVAGMGIGAGTTLAIADVQADSYRAYHVGDSVVLGIGRRGRLRYRTTAHSPVGYALESGMINEEEALLHQDRFYISNIVGDPDMKIEIGPRVELNSGDSVLLASDGLTDNFSLEEIVQHVRAEDLESLAQALAEECRARMLNESESAPSKPDDLTFVIFRARD